MKNQAFTLIEVLVAILIIGVLAAIAVPQYQKAVEKARLLQNISTVRALYDALERYRLVNDSYPPYPNAGGGGSVDISYFNNILDISIQSTEKVNYYPHMFIKQHLIGMHWGWNGVQVKQVKEMLRCESNPNNKNHAKEKELCLSVCSDKEWRTWDHGEYCKI